MTRVALSIEYELDICGRTQELRTLREIGNVLQHFLPQRGGVYLGYQKPLQVLIHPRHVQEIDWV